MNPAVEVTEVRYLLNAEPVAIVWRLTGGLYGEKIDRTDTTQTALQARVGGDAPWGDDQVLAEVRADLTKRLNGDTSTVVRLAPKPTLVASPPPLPTPQG